MAECSVRGTRLIRREPDRRLFEEQLEGAYGQPVGCRVGDLRERAEVHVEAGAVVLERPAGVDRCPVVDQVMTLSQFLARELVRAIPSLHMRAKRLRFRRFPAFCSVFCFSSSTPGHRFESCLGHSKYPSAEADSGPPNSRDFSPPNSSADTVCQSVRRGNPGTVVADTACDLQG